MSLNALLQSTTGVKDRRRSQRQLQTQSLHGQLAAATRTGSLLALGGIPGVGSTSAGNLMRPEVPVSLLLRSTATAPSPALSTTSVTTPTVKANGGLSLHTIKLAAERSRSSQTYAPTPDSSHLLRMLQQLQRSPKSATITSSRTGVTLTPEQTHAIVNFMAAKTVPNGALSDAVMSISGRIWNNDPKKQEPRSDDAKTVGRDVGATPRRKERKQERGLRDFDSVTPEFDRKPTVAVGDEVGTATAVLSALMIDDYFETVTAAPTKDIDKKEYREPSILTEIPLSPLSSPLETGEIDWETLDAVLVQIPELAEFLGYIMEDHAHDVDPHAPVEAEVVASRPIMPPEATLHESPLGAIVEDYFLRRSESPIAETEVEGPHEHGDDADWDLLL